jgi:hypothetical protein
LQNAGQKGGSVADELDENTTDRLVALTKGAAGAVPFVGGLLGELVGSVIPGQRQQRIVIYLRELEQRVEAMESADAAIALAHPDKIDLVERGGYQAIQATSDKRITEIANVVANGLSSDEADIVRRKRLLGLLGQLDDDEVAILTAYGRTYGVGGGSGAWDSINRPPPAHMQGGQELIEQNKLYDLGRERLLALNLVERRYGNVKKGEYPEFDPKAGTFKGSIEISYLGRMLLREMGIDLPFKD